MEDIRKKDAEVVAYAKSYAKDREDELRKKYSADTYLVIQKDVGIIDHGKDKGELYRRLHEKHRGERDIFVNRLDKLLRDQSQDKPVFMGGPRILRGEEDG